MAVAEESWLEAQQGVLGSALISPELVPMVLSETEDTDYSGPCLTVYQAIRSVFQDGKPVDPMTVADKLPDDFKKFLMQLMEITPTAANIKTYISLCRKQAKLAQLQELGAQLQAAADLTAAQKIVEEAVSTNAAKKSIQVSSVYEALIHFVNRHMDDEQPDFLPWPIPELENQLFVEKGDFVILAGRPSAGKTAFALQCAWRMSETKRVGFFSLETGEKKLTDRQISAVADVPLENIKRNCMNQHHWDKIIASKDEFQRRHLDLITESSLRVSDIEALSRAKKYDVIFIDYIHLLAELKSSKYEEISNISLALHRFSQTSGCCVIGLAQLNRGGESKKAGGSPDMTWLRDSGQLEQDADAVLIIYLEEEKNPNSRRILKCAKNKEGERFKMLLDFDGRTQRFSKSKDSKNYHTEMTRMANERRYEEKRKKEEEFEQLPIDTEVPFEEGGTPA